MSEKIQLTLSADRVVVGPGEKAEVTAEIRNAGDIVEVFSIEVQGIDAAWFNLSVSSVSLFPGDKETVRIGLAPPLASASRAGSYTLSVKASSRRDPAVEATVPLTVDIGAISSYELDLFPKKVRARTGSYNVRITNTGNIINTFKLEATDPEEMCRYDFRSETVAVEAGATADIPLIVNPKKKPFTGVPKQFAFTVKVTPIASEVKTVQGQLECPALLPKWALLAAVAVLAVIVVVIVLVVIQGGGGGKEFAPVDEPFRLRPGHYKMYEIHLTEGTITADAQWSGTGRVSLVLYGPGGGNLALARHEDVTPLSISHTIAPGDIAEGDSWRIYVANLDDDKEAVNGRIEITHVP